MAQPFGGMLDCDDIRTQSVTQCIAMGDPTSFTDVTLETPGFSAVDDDVASPLRMVEFAGGVGAGLAPEGEGG